jgi:hypothetical protein
LVLRRDQLATLNPNKPAATFVGLDQTECVKFEHVLRKGKPTEQQDNPGCLVEEDSLVIGEDWEKYNCQKSFSRIPVGVQVTGTELDLTFIDLPGLMKNCMA